MQNINRNIPVFIHICSLMGLKDPYLIRDQYGNADPTWEDCDQYRSVEDITWFKFVKDNNGNERVSISIRGVDKFGFLSDDVEFFKEWLT